MKPHEFTAALRERNLRDVERYVRYMADATSPARDPELTNLKSFLERPGDGAAAAGLIRKESVDIVNELALAIYVSPTIHEYMNAAASDFAVDPEIAAMVERHAKTPGGLPVDELRVLLDKITRDDRLFTGPMQVLLGDAGVRAALRLPEDFDFPTYITRVRQAIRDADNVDDIVRVASLGPERAIVSVAGVVGIFPFVVLAVAVWTAAVVLNYVGLVNMAAALAVALAVAVKVTILTVSGPSAESSAIPTIPIVEGRPHSICVNETRQVLWVVARGPWGIKRVPLPPGKSSVGMGLPVIEAILIGGNFNPLRTVRRPTGGICGEGAYVLWRSEERPGLVRCGTTSDGKGMDIVQAVVNEAQAEAESAGLAGYSDLKGGGSAGTHFDARFTMAGVAAAMPEGFDVPSLVDCALDADHFFRSLRLAMAARHFTGVCRV